jgi:hypothetical protein
VSARHSTVPKATLAGREVENVTGVPYRGTPLTKPKLASASDVSGTAECHVGNEWGGSSPGAAGFLDSKAFGQLRERVVPEDARGCVFTDDRSELEAFGVSAADDPHVTPTRVSVHDPFSVLGDLVVTGLGAEEWGVCQRRETLFEDLARLGPDLRLPHRCWT